MPDTVVSYVLDSFALLAYFQAEPGGEMVRSLIEAVKDEQAALYMSLINVGELYYNPHRLAARTISGVCFQYFRTNARYAAGWRHCNNCDSSRALRFSSRSTVATAYPSTASSSAVCTVPRGPTSMDSPPKV